MSKKKVALVTGGARGIGEAIVIELAKDGYNVIINYHSSKKEALALEKIIKEYTDDCLLIKCDISKEDEVEKMVEEAIKKFNKIDVLVNNAGISNDSLFNNKTADTFRNVLDVNLVGTFLVSKYVGKTMVENKYGKIVNIVSTNGINTYYPMCLEYDSSKAGIVSLTHNLAIQFSPYVNVNAVAPGFIGTDSELKNMDQEFIKSEEEKIFLGRMGKPEEVAKLVKFLVSDEASYINNEIIRIDGGMYGNY